MSTDVADMPVFPFTTVPDHTQLPDSDGTFVKHFQEHPQSILLTDSILPILGQLHPDGQFCIGQDCGIYWNLMESLGERPARGAISPDWFYVPNVPPLLKGVMRRSYVLWQEFVAPTIVIEFVSRNDSEERDRTPVSGKFWVYEQAIRVPFYAIYEVERASVEVYHLENGSYIPLVPNEHGRYHITPMSVELGIWQGSYGNLTFPWLRWWDGAGKLLPTGEERAEQEYERAEQERVRAERSEERATRLADRLRALGIDPDAL